MITSKGASGVTGAGFITLAATLAIVPDIPIPSLAILVGIDKFMSECRALTNLDRQRRCHRRDQPAGKASSTRTSCTRRWRIRYKLGEELEHVRA